MSCPDECGTPEVGGEYTGQDCPVCGRYRWMKYGSWESCEKCDFAIHEDHAPELRASIEVRLPPRQAKKLRAFPLLVEALEKKEFDQEDNGLQWCSECRGDAESGHPPTCPTDAALLAAREASE